MVFWTRFAVTFLTLLSCLVVLTIVESKEELTSLKRSPYESSSVAEEMVCSNTEGEKNCKALVDDASVDDMQDNDESEDDDESDDDDNDNDDESDGDDDDEEEDDKDDFDGDFHNEFIHKAGDDEECVNNEVDCQFWANLEPSECKKNPSFMLSNCKLACKACEKHKRYSDEPPTADGRDLGEPQSFKGNEEISSEEIENRVAASQKYMNRQIQLGTIDPELLWSCRNTDESCTFWSLLGECEDNSAYMQLSCGPACFSCDMLSIEKRCPMDREIIGPDVWSPGDLDNLFRKLSSEPYKSKYDVNVLSSPDNNGGGPWVLTMENVVGEDEADRLIELGSVEGYERSTDVGEMKPDGTTDNVVSTGRTSLNAWCSDECIEDEVVEAVNNRISNMTEIPILNSEDLQLLRYGPGQLYVTHHDYIEYEIDRQAGVRIITVYLYLNDVEAGGGTNFPDLDITVMPKRGRVLIWPSVLDSDPNQKDDRTEHQALPVEAGIKYGANAWFHMRNFRRTIDNDC